MNTHNSLKSIVSAIITLSAFTGAAQAESFDSMTSATANIIFTQPVSPLSLSITPASGNLAGVVKSQYQVATYKLTSTLSSRIGVRFSPSAGTPGSSENIMTFTGKNNSTNKASLEIIAPSGSSIVVDNNSFWVSKTNVSDFSGTIKTHGSQTIKPDTYPISMDAVVYTP